MTPLSLPPCSIPVPGVVPGALPPEVLPLQALLLCASQQGRCQLNIIRITTNIYSNIYFRKYYDSNHSPLNVNISSNCRGFCKDCYKNKYKLKSSISSLVNICKYFRIFKGYKIILPLFKIHSGFLLLNMRCCLSYCIFNYFTII